MAIDTSSDTWAVVKAWAEAEIVSAQRSIERPGLEPVPTEFERARIATARNVLALPTARMKPTIPSPSRY